jgi:tetratricopeptide (TPR) repeat protein
MAQSTPNHCNNAYFRFYKSKYFILCIIFIAVSIAYNSTLQYPLIFDDYVTLIENFSIRDLNSLSNILVAPHEIGLAWRPFANFTFAISYALSGLDPWGHHLVNIGLHCLTAYILFSVLRLTFTNQKLKLYIEGDATLISGSISILWAIHPVQTQTVTYISQRTETLMALMFLLTLYCFIRAKITESKLWLIASIVSCFLGAMCKEVIVTAPLVVYLYDRTFISGSFKKALIQHWIYYSAICLSWPLLGILLSTMRNQAVGFNMGITPYVYALTECKAVITYIRLSYIPYPLIFDRGPLFIHSLREALPYAIILLVLLSVSTWALIKKPQLGFIFACYFIVLSPTSSIVPVATVPIAENRLYLPLAATLCLGVLTLRHCLKKHYLRTCLIILIFVCTVASFVRNQVYSSAISIWKDTTEKIPKNPRAHNNLGFLLYNTTDRVAEAKKEIEIALQYDPQYADAYNNLGLILATFPNEQSRAIVCYQKSIDLNPDNAEAHTNLANALGKDPNRLNDAKKHIEKALRLKPYSAEFHNDYAIILANEIATQNEAISHYEEAIRLKPAYEEAHNNLANVLTLIPGKEKEALLHYEIALKLNPNSGVSHYNFALFLKQHSALFPNSNALERAAYEYNQAILLGVWKNPSDIAVQELNIANVLSGLPGKSADATKHYTAALKLSDRFPDAHLNYAEFLSNQTDPDRTQIIAHYELALRDAPNSALLHLSYAHFLENIDGKLPEAISHYLSAIKLDSKLFNAHEALGRIYSQNSQTIAAAISHYRIALQINPKSTYSHINLGLLLGNSPGKQIEAEQHFKDACLIDPNNPEVHNNYGAFLASLNGKNKEAIDEYRHAILLNQNYAEAHNNLANILATKPENRIQAIEEYKAALQDLPNSYVIHYNLALQLEKMPSMHHEALIHYKEVLRLNSNFNPARAAIIRLLDAKAE